MGSPLMWGSSFFDYGVAPLVEQGFLVPNFPTGYSTAMKLLRWRFSRDWNTGTYTNTRLDTLLNISQYNHPSVMTTTNITTTTPYTGYQMLSSTGGITTTLSNPQTTNQWARIGDYMTTTQCLDAVSFTTTAQQVIINLTGNALAQSSSGVTSPFLSGSGGTYNITSNQIQNGSIVQVLLDGTLYASADTYNASPTVTMYLDGNSHTIKIIHSGQYNSGIQPIGSPSNVTGTSVASKITATPNLLVTPGFITAQWRITGNSGGTTYKLEKALPPVLGGSPSWTTVSSSLTCGTTYTNQVPGVSLTVATGLTNGDQATFTTSAVTATIMDIQVQTGSGNSHGVYTSEVLGPYDPNTEWCLADWTENQPMYQFTISTGNTPTPDGTWTSVTVTPTEVSLPFSGAKQGVAAFPTAPTGSYAQWTLSFPMAPSSVAFIQDLNLFCWVPDQDPVIVSKLSLGKNVALGPDLNAIIASILADFTQTYTQALDLRDSNAISGATDQALLNYGADLKLNIYPSEDPLTYRTRILASLQSRTTGGSIPTIAQQINLLVNGVQNTVSTSLTGGLYSATCGGVTVSQSSTSQNWKVTIPPPVSGQYPGLPGLPLSQAQTIITNHITQYLTSVNSVLQSITFN